MKHLLLALSAALCLSACAGARVVRTEVATGALHPKSIYIRPFSVGANSFQGAHHGTAAKIIRQSQAPLEFANVLKEELEKIAPAIVIGDNETADVGWIIEGDIDLVHGGSAFLRGTVGHTGIGRSTIKLHVRVLDANLHGDSDGKGTARRNVLYEFDILGGSRMTGPAGSIMAPGVGHSVQFDYRNAAERIGQVLDPESPRYGIRTSASLR